MGYEEHENPMSERKANLDENPVGVMRKLQEMKRRDQGKVPLRINFKTVIMVTPENCTPEYAQQMNKKFNR